MEKFLVIGGGSMGKRRIRCLQAHGVDARSIRMVDQRADRRREVQARYDVVGLASAEEGMAWNPDIVIVSVPTRDHLRFCRAAAEAGKDFFCEIALADGLEGTGELLALVRKRGLIAALGIQTPFHPAVRQATEWIRDSRFGRPLSYTFLWGNYLPNWHPWEDYRDFYDATQFLGVAAEDLGQMESFLGDQLAECTCRAKKLGSLQIDGGDHFLIGGTTTAGTAVTMQFDLLQDVQQTWYRIAGENGTVECNLFPEVSARRWLQDERRFETFVPPEGYRYEQCYIDEFGAFLQACRDRTPWHHPLERGIAILEVLDGLRRSFESGEPAAVTPRQPLPQEAQD